MCGIVGVIGKSPAQILLLEGLKRLEYRGYDSAGIAVHEAGGLVRRRALGRLRHLSSLVASDPTSGRCGIGHTRWATHGEPAERNSHPHHSNDGRIAVVHNGIIENYRELREDLDRAGVSCSSETDTEVLAHALAHALTQGAKDVPEALHQVLAKVRGAYALAILDRDQPDTIYAARSGSPLVIGQGADSVLLASDTAAIQSVADEVMYLDDGQVATLHPNHIEVTTLAGIPVTLERHPVESDEESHEKGGFDTFMLKEIHEQPRILRKLLNRLIDDEWLPCVPELDVPEIADALRNAQRIRLVGCGTAHYAGQYGALLLEDLCEIEADAVLGSEFRYRKRTWAKGDLVIAVSQSGETADTLASTRLAAQNNVPVIAVCNVPGSSLARESDATVFTECGAEIGVASTKAFTAQLLVLLMMALHIQRRHRSPDELLLRDAVSPLFRVPDAIHHVLRRADTIRAIAEKHCDGPSALYLGRRYNVPVAYEGALKNKEISYQHAEAYPAGELKHGPIALVHEYLPVICLCTETDDDVYDKMLSNMEEVKARNGRIIAIACDGDTQVTHIAEDLISVPRVPERYSPLINTIALQLLAYYSAHARGTDIDRPRNLAKSVTVE